MSKKKKNQKSFNSLDALKGLKVDDGEIQEKSPEEIEMEKKEKDKLKGLLITINTNNFHMNHKSPISQGREAYAPYNFVPLNDGVVLSDFSINKTPFDKFHLNRFTGYITLNIEAKTPVYIRNTYTKEQIDKIKEIDDSIEEAKKNKMWAKVENLESNKIDLLWEYNKFYSPGNKEIKLSGSTQRGMIRTLVEIASFGFFKNFENKRLYMRGFADRALRSVYNSFGLSSFRAGAVSYTMNCGILKQNGSRFFIKDSGTPYQIAISNARKRVRGLGKFYSEFEFYEDISANEFIVVTGSIGGKRNDWIIPFPEPTANKMYLTDEDIKEYNDDSNRLEKADLLKRLSSYPNGIPCFYKQWTDDAGNTRTTLGHTGMFRVPYKKTIAQHIPQQLVEVNKLDFSEAIFGNESVFAGRVFFEDAICNKLVEINDAMHPQILSGPKPTTFQHYLTQPKDQRDYLKHYNPDNAQMLSEIRGYKLYWHKKNNTWWVEEETALASKKQFTKIKPVDTGTKFLGKIRFENLSKEELGALLFVLDLPEGCNHKIGMAKPLGLGSIEIKPELYISMREDRYSELENEWKTPISKSSEQTIIDFKDAFATYVLKVINQKIKEYSFSDLWQEDRMKELKRMLTFDNGIASKNLEYMGLGEFTERKVLPKPTDVK